MDATANNDVLPKILSNSGTGDLTRRTLVSHGIVSGKTVLIVGDDLFARHLAYYLKTSRTRGIDRFIFLPDQVYGASRRSTSETQLYPELSNILQSTKIDETWIATRAIVPSEILALCQTLVQNRIRVFVRSPFSHPFESELKDPSFIRSFTKINRLPTSTSRILKRGVDLFLAVTLGILISIPIAIIALLVKLTSKGPAIYSSSRVGKNGKTFVMFKIRTMKLDGESKHESSVRDRLKLGYHMGSVANDDRVTWLGKYLRAFNLDELPQIWNIICGDMSFIGPRPYLPYEIVHFTEWHHKRCKVLPGLTGLWQVTARQQDKISLDEALYYDVFYAYYHSLRMDVTIVLKTFGVLFHNARVRLAKK